MSDSDTALEDTEERDRLAARRLSVTLRCYDKLMDYFAQQNAAEVYRGDTEHTAPHLDGKWIAQVASQHADMLLMELENTGGEA